MNEYPRGAATQGRGYLADSAGIRGSIRRMYGAKVKTNGRVHSARFPGKTRKARRSR